MWIAEKIYYQGSSGYTRAYQGTELVWEQPTHNYITFTSLEGALTPPSEISLGSLATGQTIEYSYDGYNWSSMTEQTVIEVESSQSVYMRGMLTSNNTDSNYTNFITSGNFKISGNINYLWNKDNPDAALKEYCGYNLFNGCTALSDVSELELPANTLAISCYQNMFRNTRITTAPVLPATTLAESCYRSMFNSCTSLTSAPALPATTLATYCYFYMFENCSALTTAPELPATTLANYCYRDMFRNSGIYTAPELPATTLAESCYRSMFNSCANLTTPPALPATALTSYCYYYMFENCTSLQTAPELPATTLRNYCYGGMFNNCTSLTTAPELPATTLSAYCYRYMFSGCTNLNYIKCLATDISANQCTIDWVSGVAASGTFVKDPNMTSWTIGNSGIPTGWTVEGGIPAVKFTAKANSSSVGLTKISTGQTIEYSTNGITWTNMTTATSISLSSGQSVYIRGILSSNNTDSNNTQFKMTGNIKASDNINYLWNKDNPDAALKEYCGAALFSGCTALTDVVDLALPATTLSARCYRNMFRNTRITKAPELPATTLATYCYSSMFNSCTSLTSAPALPATTLATYCYYYMFENCTSLTTAPVLPALTLINYCYNNMFKNCSSLNYIKCFATDRSASNCTVNWVSGVASTGTFVKNPLMSSWPINSANGIPTNWTVQDGQAPPTGTTEEYWWTGDGSVEYFFDLPTKWNNGYMLEMDVYTQLDYSSDIGPLIEESSTFPIEIHMYYNGYYSDGHYPNNTSTPTVNTTDYDVRALLSNARYTTDPQTHSQIIHQRNILQTKVGWLRIIDKNTQEVLYTTGTEITGLSYCTTQNYVAHVSCTDVRYSSSSPAPVYVGDIKVYDDNNNLIHNWQLYPTNSTYAYWDAVEQEWYNLSYGSITRVSTTTR